ncbi:type II toxin-antitoxin system RelE/ParE family toxin [Nitrospirillum viridazoti]|uniref:Addiction module toxin RelE n=1 Tax=Nitrospirillum viridazoti CBAmc TaxID=1441467 RepID=A0A248JYS9_9PROT|nr:type II toxin-antitoxin system RelE/ParE family toxin [Nitrospirillum amazonense]ASG23308.1 addiction module toxin RelE [Nitrospirillum amazonense CBAmc]
MVLGRREVRWVASSHKDLREFPEDVQDLVGFGLYQAQIGKKHPNAKPLKGFGGSQILELLDDHDGDAYRCVYTVRFEAAIYVLHAFQKKSKRGIATPQADMDLIRTRLKLAEEDHRRRQKDKRNE